MSARETILDYDEALRRDESRSSFFTASSDMVTVGTFSRWTGGDHVADSRREQTRITTDRTVDTDDRQVVEMHVSAAHPRHTGENEGDA